MTAIRPNSSTISHVLYERELIYLLSQDSGWTADRRHLPKETKTALRALLEGHVPEDRLQEAMATIDLAFDDVCQAALHERQKNRDSERSTAAKKPSTKIGVELRETIRTIQKAMEQGAYSPEQICASVTNNCLLEKLVTLELEAIIRPMVVDPLRQNPRLAAKALPLVLAQLHSSVDAGIKRGRIQASDDMLADAIATVILRTSGRAPKRIYDTINDRESGFGLECCRLIAQAVNEAMPPELRQENSAEMAKAWRRMTDQMI